MTDVERVIEGRFRHPSIALLFCRHLVSTKVRALVVEAPGAGPATGAAPPVEDDTILAEVAETL